MTRKVNRSVGWLVDPFYNHCLLKGLNRPRWTGKSLSILVNIYPSGRHMTDIVHTIHGGCLIRSVRFIDMYKINDFL